MRRGLLILCALAGGGLAAAEQGCAGVVPAHDRPGVIPRERHFEFEGRTWWVRADNGGASGPGGNRWDDGPQAARVTSEGIALAMQPDAEGIWRSVEILTPLPARYGCLELELSGFVDRHSPEVVAAVFVYRDDSSEFDIEWTRFGRGELPNGHYTIASTGPIKQRQFRFKQRTEAHNIRIRWEPGVLAFDSSFGPSWQHKGVSVPRPDAHYLHIALWRVHGLAPWDGRPQSLLVKSVRFERRCGPGAL